ASSAPKSARSWLHWAGWGTLLLLCVSGARIAMLALRSRRFLGSLQRAPLAEAESTLAALSSSGVTAAVMVSESAQIAVPTAISSQEVCLPRGCWEALTPASREALLAHELAHLSRRDPMWFRLVAYLERGLFFLPWVAWTAKRFRRSAEFACDQQAAAWTGSRVGVARCLSDVASWLGAERRAPVPYALPSMVSWRGGSKPSPSLVARVQHLLESEGRPEEPMATGRGASWAGVALLGVLACSAPVVTGAENGAKDQASEATAASIHDESGAAIVIGFSEGSIATATRSAHYAPMEPLTCDVFSREGREALARWLREARGPLPKEPLDGPSDFGRRMELVTSKLAVAAQPGTRFREVQTVMSLAGDVGVLMPEVALLVSGREYPVPLPRDLGVEAAVAGSKVGVVDVLLRRDDGRLKYNLVIAEGPLVSPPVEIEEESEGNTPTSGLALPDAARVINTRKIDWVDTSLSELMDGLSVSGARIDARAGTTVNEVTEVIDVLTDHGISQLTFTGSYER
ncbi:MAG: M56 family metallopeptidase, partial [Planctomycetota bacterium]